VSSPKVGIRTIAVAGLAAAIVLAACLVWPAPAHAEPCVTTAAACTEWVALGGGPERSLIYRTFGLDGRNEAITRALVMVHGAGRNADGYFRTAVAAAFLAGALGDTVVIAPRLASNDGRICRDSLAPDEINWPCTGNSWRAGGVAVTSATLTSHDLADEILRRLARKEIFPNLGAIVVAGHSAGGQYVSRYQMANGVHEALGVRVGYVVSNPSSYAYLDPDRPAASTSELRPYPDARNCTTYDHWPYGLQNRSGYAARVSDDQLRKQLAERSVTYLLGELDTMPLANFDASCPAMAQGPHRLARGQAFAGYVNQRYGARHQVTVIPLCGHNARCMFTAEPALSILFPKP
jgi:pimeloyl-ACP methyl ester carboxylesterase